jgi:integrase
MGRKSLSGGVAAKGKERIEFTFVCEGVRYRPTILRTPSEANLRRAHVQLADIKARINAGTFRFEEEFPDYRLTTRLGHESQRAAIAPLTPTEIAPPPQPKAERTCKQVFDAFLKHCEVRVAGSDMAYSTLNSYRKILARNWRPRLDAREFKSVTYGELVEIAGEQGWRTKKTYNNGISPLRCAFEFGYKDHRDIPNPAEGLDSFKITKIDRPRIDPFTIHEAEKIILGVHGEFGEAQGNFDEFRFFTGLRQSEEISLQVAYCDLAKGTISIEHVVVLGKDKNRPKNNEARTVELCPRALSVLKRQLALRDMYARAGRLDHDFVFFKEDGKCRIGPYCTSDIRSPAIAVQALA